MQFTLKISDISQIINIEPRIIKQWTVEYQIPYQRNEQGYNVYDVHGIEQLKQIKRIKNEKQIIQHKTADHLEEKMNQLLNKIDMLEEKLSTRLEQTVNKSAEIHEGNISQTLKGLEKVEERFSVKTQDPLSYTG